MLMMIGPLQFKVAPFNATEYSRAHGATYAEKPVIGARPPLEFMGTAGEKISIKAILFPETLGENGNLALLTALRAAGVPQFMIRGDGALFGWVVIEAVTETSTYLAANGVGKQIDVDITLRRAQAPTPAGYFAAISSMFGGIL